MSKTNNSAKRPFGMRDKLCYACGDMANDFTFILMSSFMMKFYTDIMAIPASMVGILMMAARIVDAFTDVGMGALVDGTDPNKSKYGKFRVWMLRGMLPLVVFGVLVFCPVLKDASYGLRVFWMFFTYLMWGSVFYTCVNIPYGSMASAITDDPNERAQLTSFRSMGATIAGMVIMSIAPMFVYVTDAKGNQILDSKAMMTFAVICAVVAIILYLICIMGSVDRVVVAVKKKEKGAKKDPNEPGMLKVLFSNKAALLLIIGTVFFILAQMTNSGMANYVYPNYYGDTAAQSIGSLLLTGVSFVAAMISPTFVKKFGKKETSIIAMAVGAGAMLITYVIKPANVWIFIVFSGIAGFALGLYNAMCFAMIIDVCDDSYVKTDRRDDGKFYGLYSWARKLGQAVASALTGVLLDAIGYTSGIAAVTAGTADALDKSVMNGIFTITTLVPALGFCIALVFFFIYPLNKKRVDENTRIIREKMGK